MSYVFLLLKILIQMETDIKYMEGSLRQYNRDEAMVQTEQEHVYQRKEERGENTYWGEPHDSKNPNRESEVHKEDDE